MTKITRLPTTAPSFLQVRKAGRRWFVEIVTPVLGKQLRTALAKTDDYEAAVSFARETAEIQQRPLKLPKGVALEIRVGD